MWALKELKDAGYLVGPIIAGNRTGFRHAIESAHTERTPWRGLPHGLPRPSSTGHAAAWPAPNAPSGRPFLRRWSGFRDLPASAC